MKKIYLLSFLMTVFFGAWQVSAQYCTPSAASNDDTGLTNVTFNTIDNDTGSADAYVDHTDISTDVTIGDSYDLEVVIDAVDSFYTVQAKAWIDWNQDEVFDTATEEYDLGEVSGVAEGPPSLSPLSIEVPATALEGATVMRVRAVYGTTANPDPCSAQSWSEAEDYTINVMAAGGGGATAGSIFEDFNSGIPAGWTTDIISGSCDWELHTPLTALPGFWPAGYVFPTDAMYFDDDACGSGQPANTALLYSDVYDMSGNTVVFAEMSYDA